MVAGKVGDRLEAIPACRGGGLECGGRMVFPTYSGAFHSASAYIVIHHTEISPRTVPRRAPRGQARLRRLTSVPAHNRERGRCYVSLHSETTSACHCVNDYSSILTLTASASPNKNICGLTGLASQVTYGAIIGQISALLSSSPQHRR